MSDDHGTSKDDDIEEVTDEDVIAFTQRAKIPSLIPAHRGLSEEEKLKREKAKQLQNRQSSKTQHRQSGFKTTQRERRSDIRTKTPARKTPERKPTKSISGTSDRSEMSVTARMTVPSVLFAHKEPASTKQIRRLSELARERATTLEPGSDFKTFQGETSSTNTEIRTFTKRAPVPKVIPAHRGLTEEEKQRRKAAQESTAKLTSAGEKTTQETHRRSTNEKGKRPSEATKKGLGNLETLDEEEAGPSDERRQSETRRLTVPDVIPAHKDPQSTKQLRRVSEAERERNNNE